MQQTQSKAKRRLPRPIELIMQFAGLVVFGLIMASDSFRMSLPDSLDHYILKFVYVIVLAIICCYVLPGIFRQLVFRFLRNRSEAPV